MRNPNCVVRGSVWPVERPKSPLERSLLGGVRFTLLNRLNSSARISKVAPSEVNHGILIALIALKFTLASPGPSKVFRPSVPCCPPEGRGKLEAANKPLRKSPRDVEI